MFGKKKPTKKVVEKKQKSKKSELKQEVVAQSEKVLAAITEVRVLKAYKREGVLKVDILRHEEVDVNGRKCHKVELVDGTSDLVPDEDPLKQLVW